MTNKLKKIRQYVKVINNQRWINKRPVENILQVPCGYKEGHTPPPTAAMSPFSCGENWGTGKDSHAWFRFSVAPENENTYLRIETEFNGWDADNPQFMLYIDGALIQGLDTNHREAPLACGAAAVTLWSLPPLSGWAGAVLPGTVYCALLMLCLTLWSSDTAIDRAPSPLLP